MSEITIASKFKEEFEARNFVSCIEAAQHISKTLKDLQENQNMQHPRKWGDSVYPHQSVECKIAEVDEPWRYLYFHYPKGKNTAEFKVSAKENEFKTIASFNPDPSWWGQWRPRWSDWFDTGLLELATGVKVGNRRSEHAKEPICTVKHTYPIDGGKGFISAVHPLPYARFYKGRFVMLNARKKSESVRIPMGSKERPRAVWMFGIYKSDSSFNVFSLMLQSDPDKPILCTRAVREYYYDDSDKLSELSLRIFHDFFLEFTALSLLNETGNFYRTFRELLSLGIMPLAIFEHGKLRTTRLGTNRRRAQFLLIESLEHMRRMDELRKTRPREKFRASQRKKED